MANFSPRFERNPLEMEKLSAWVENPSPFSETGLGVSAQTNGLKNPQKVRVNKTEFQPGLRRPREHAQRGSFPDNKIAYILARAEICHVIATIFHPAPPS